jgi:transcriptional regulator with XRE-family HTH domain
MSTADGTAPAAPGTVAGAADSGEHPVGRLRRLRGLTQAELAERVGCHCVYLAKLERGVKSPSVGLACRLADALGVDVIELGYGEPRRCQCRPGCPALTFGRLAEHHVGDALRRGHRAGLARQRELLESHMRAHDLITADELAAEVGCSVATLHKYVRRGLLPARVYAGYWHGRRPLLLDRGAIAAAAELLGTARLRSREGARRWCGAHWTPQRRAALAAWNRDYWTPPRRAALAALKRDYWATAEGRATMLLALARHLREAHGQTAMLRMVGRHASEIARARGRSVGLPEFSPRRVVSADTRARILDLRARGLSQELIADRLGVSRGSVRHVLRNRANPHG